MRVAYLDPVSGVSGDMLLGALIDAGLEVERLSEELRGLQLDAWSLNAERVQRAGFAATKAHIRIEAGAPPRTLAQILELIERSALPPADREQAGRVFRLLGEAEAAVHGASDVGGSHLHEVGAVDAIIDVVGAVAGLRLLGVERLYTGPLPCGGDTVRAQHGRLPVPAPAVLEVLARAGAPLAAARAGEPAAELVTPTGAAIVAGLASFERPAMRLERVGIGAGGRDFEAWPNVTRLWVGELGVGDLGVGEAAGVEASDASAAHALAARPMVLIETDIDDMLPEHLPFLEERLREAGARDVWWSAVQMKKGRPGVEVTAVAEPAAEQAVALAMLRHSSTLGVRVTPLVRYEAAREVFEFASSLGAAAVKVKRLPGEPPRVAPEYEVCRALAEVHSLPLAEVYRLVTAEAMARLGAE